MLRNIYILVLVFSLWGRANAQEDRSIQFVAKAAMQTAKSKNFQDLAENLFSDPSDREEVLRFLKMHQLLNRSLPDIIAEGPRITIKERSILTTLDFSEAHLKSLKVNGQKFNFSGQEKYMTIYQAFKRIQKKERKKSDLPVLALVSLAAYAKASISLNTGKSF